MKFIVVVEQVGILAILMAVGYIASRVKVINENESRSMTALLTNISLPALILSAFNIGYSKDTLKGVVIIFVLSIVIHLVAALIGKIAFMKYPKAKNRVLRFGNVFANSGFMGVPFVYALFGKDALLYGSVYTIPFHILMWTYGEPLLKEKKEKVTILNIFKNPAMIAIVIGMMLFVSNISLPNVMAIPISMLSALTLPLAMLILGEKISKMKLKEAILDKDIYYSSFIKLIVVPLVIFLILKPIDIDPLIKNIIIIMQSLPAAVLTVVLAEKHNGDVELASKFSVASHILSILTIPLISLLL